MHKILSTYLVWIFVIAIGLAVLGLSLTLLSSFGDRPPQPLAPTLVVRTRQARESTLQAAWSTLVETTGFVSVTNPEFLEFDGKRLWIASYDGNMVQAIDPVSHQVLVGPVEINHPGLLAFYGQSIWVVGHDSENVGVIRPIDVNTDVAGPPIQVGSGVCAIVYDGTRLWVANYFDDTVQAIDPVAGRVSEPIRVGSQPRDLAVDRIHRRLWVANMDDNTVQAIDLDKGISVGEPIAVGDYPNTLAFDGSRLWVLCLDGIQSIDPVTREVGPLIHLESPCALAFDGTRLWVANYYCDTVQAFDTATGKLSEPIPLRGAAWDMEFDGTRLWVSLPDDDQVQYLVPLK